MKYTNIHDYLDAVFGEIENPSNAQIKQAKRDYWKLWYKHYRQKRRKNRKEFTLSFNAEYLQKIHDKKGVLNTSEFLYKAVAIFVDDKEMKLFDESLLKTIKHQLMQLINQLEELLEIDATTLDETLLNKIETLEDQFSKLINN